MLMQATLPPLAAPATRTHTHTHTHMHACPQRQPPPLAPHLRQPQVQQELQARLQHAVHISLQAKRGGAARERRADGTSTSTSTSASTAPSATPLQPYGGARPGGAPAG